MAWSRRSPVLVAHPDTGECVWSCFLIWVRSAPSTAAATSGSGQLLLRVVEEASNSILFPEAVTLRWLPSMCTVRPVTGRMGWQQEVSSLMAAGDMTQEREEHVIADLLRERVGIDPGMLGSLVDLAAMGLVNGAWRNTCVENWHAEGRMHDGDMLRVNSHTTSRVRQIMRRWMKEVGLDAAAPASALDGVAADDVWWLAGRLYQWLVIPSRKLPIDMTLAQLAGDGLPEYRDDADKCLGAFGAQAEERGTRFGFARTAAHGGLACGHWWGHPRWPTQVQRFIDALDNPADDHWGPDGKYRAELPAEPADLADHTRLRRLLLSQPWELSTDAAQWLVHAGIRYVRT